jgi:hypothetical protein
LKEEAVDRIKWRNRFGRGCGPVVWQITDDKKKVQSYFSHTVKSYLIYTVQDYLNYTVHCHLSHTVPGYLGYTAHI